jgi:DNA-binding NarL/FixJ family response regulator
LAKGRCVNEIADELFISNKTVSTHKARMMEKMGFQNTADIVRYAISHDLAD